VTKKRKSRRKAGAAARPTGEPTGTTTPSEAPPAEPAVEPIAASTPTPPSSEPPAPVEPIATAGDDREPPASEPAAEPIATASEPAAPTQPMAASTPTDEREPPSSEPPAPVEPIAATSTLTDEREPPSEPAAEPIATESEPASEPAAPIEPIATAGEDREPPASKPAAPIEPITSAGEDREPPASEPVAPTEPITARTDDHEPPPTEPAPSIEPGHPSISGAVASEAPLAEPAAASDALSSAEDASPLVEEAQGERRSGVDRRQSVRLIDDPEAATLPEPEPVGLPASRAPVALDPAAAAFEAARIAGEIVGDIESASGAAIVAAAAAGAAIEATRARMAAGSQSPGPEPDPQGTAMAATALAAASQALQPAEAASLEPSAEELPLDPVVTVRMHRERILRALADDIAGSPAIAEVAAPASEGATPAAPASARPAEEDDPVQLAAAAIQRLRTRATTDLAELRVQYQRHDLVVVIAAFVLIVIAGRIHASMVTPETIKFPPASDERAQRGLSFEYPRGWLRPEGLEPWPPRILRDPTGQPPRAPDAYHVAMTWSYDPKARIEILVDTKPAWTNVITGLELERRTRWGELYSVEDSSVEGIEDQDWLRTAYRYAHAPQKGDVPRVDHAIEYATVDREQIYVVTLFADQRTLAELDAIVAPTLRIAARPGTRSAQRLGSRTRTRTSGARSYPAPVGAALDSTVMIVVADLVDGRLQARGGGSGVIVGADGSILTTYHVIADKNGRLHDAFVIGRSSSVDGVPQLVCAGRPSRSKLQRELDLALVKCDTDLDGRTWTPADALVWPTLVETKPADVKIGQRIWVLGYPDTAGGGLNMSQGSVDGWTGQDGREGRDFLKVDAAISLGNSGGPVVDDQGRLVGIASFLRVRASPTGGVQTKQEKLVRPIATASDLLAIAAIGWTPRDGHTDVEIEPTAVEAPTEGTRIETIVLDAANEAPIRDALVMVMRPGVTVSEIDLNRSDDQVLSWGRTNTQGEVKLNQRIPVGTYTVVVRARGYEPLIGEDRLRIEETTPPRYDPWGSIKLLAR
jgi:S1-C subfamily serine protease